jgi:hypothetical protein
MKSVYALLVVLSLTAGAPAFFAADTLPTQLTDAEFWKMIQDFSEPDGPFPYENFVSNESNYQTVIPTLKQTIKPGGVYLGVAPEQNFTYAAAIQPKISFVIDIRRQNMLEHLMYKALFEMSPTRADFLSNLFSRPRNADLADTSGLDRMFDALDRIRPSRAMFNQTLQSMRQSMSRHKFALSSKDLDRIEYIFNAFYNGGPKMDYKFQSATPSQRVPPFDRLMLSDDRAGTNWNFLATKATYDRVRDMQARNAIVPIVGDFAGPKALRSIAKYLKDHGAVVSAFYISNVEYYIQQDGPKKWASYMENLAALPVGPGSTVIRWTSSTDVTSLEALKPR